MRTSFFVAKFTFFGLAALAMSSADCGSSSKTTACSGAERCDCYPNQTCNAGLTCLSNMCVATTPGGTGGILGGNGGAEVVPPAGTGGGIPGAGGALPGLGGVVVPPAGTGGVVVPPAGTGGVVVPPAGTGGVVIPSTGAGGVVVPPGGTGGATVPPAGPNLLKNGDFSQGKVYWDLTWQAGDVASSSYSGGEYCVANASSSYYLSFSLGYPSSPSDAFAVEAGATYTLSYQVIGWGSIEAKVGGALSPYTPVASFADSVSSSTTARTFTHVVTPTTSVTQTGLVFNGELYYSDSVCFDNVTFAKN